MNEGFVTFLLVTEFVGGVLFGAGVASLFWMRGR